jgi:hypothetical protein
MLARASSNKFVRPSQHIRWNRESDLFGGRKAGLRTRGPVECIPVHELVGLQ